MKPKNISEKIHQAFVHIFAQEPKERPELIPKLQRMTEVSENFFASSYFFKKTMYSLVRFDNRIQVMQQLKKEPNYFDAVLNSPEIQKELEKELEKE